MTQKAKKAGKDKRRSPRASIKARVDYEIESEDTFLFEYTTNLSRDGIFLQTNNPLEPDTVLSLRFNVPESNRVIEVQGKVIWVNEFRPKGENLNPGMGIQFIDLSDDDKDLITKLIKKKAYLSDD